MEKNKQIRIYSTADDISGSVELWMEIWISTHYL